ncbi:MAG: hypothetical protein H0T89_19750 [Deltaproteobacteria bacterium]|nr:hypothetical protein [Deltaproteobacteria bacterium]MDQ3295740.1 hypothetical protein [Myxococcota bacterium]
MEFKPSIEHPRFRFRKLLVGAAITCSAVAAASLLASRSASTSPPSPPPITKISVSPIAVPMVVPITITLPSPPEPIIEDAPEPSPPRAIAPKLDAECVGVEDPSDACAWDDGFPAISADGKTIAVKHHHEDAGRGHPGLSIELVDARTSRITRTLRLLSPDEYDPDVGLPTSKIARRVIAAQRVLDAGHFRSLVRVVTTDLESTASPLRVELVDAAVRVIDTSTSSAVWQHRFTVEAAFPDQGPYPETDNCNINRVGDIAVWWDAPSRSLLSLVDYEAGPCYCNGATRAHVIQLGDH